MPATSRNCDRIWSRADRARACATLAPRDVSGATVAAPGRRLLGHRAGIVQAPHLVEDIEDFGPAVRVGEDITLIRDRQPRR